MASNETLSPPQPAGPAPELRGPESDADQLRRWNALAEAEIAREVIGTAGQQRVNAALEHARKLPPEQQADYQRRLFTSKEEGLRVVGELLELANPTAPAAPATTPEEFRALQDRASRLGDPEAARRIAATDPATWGTAPSPHAPKMDGLREVYSPAKDPGDWRRIYADAARGDQHAMRRLQISEPERFEAVRSSARIEGARTGDILAAPGNLQPADPNAPEAPINVMHLSAPRPVAIE